MRGERCSRAQHREQAGGPLAMAPVLAPREGGERGTDEPLAGMCLSSA